MKDIQPSPLLESQETLWKLDLEKVEKKVKGKTANDGDKDYLGPFSGLGQLEKEDHHQNGREKKPKNGHKIGHCTKSRKHTDDAFPGSGILQKLLLSLLRGAFGPLKQEQREPTPADEKPGNERNKPALRAGRPPQFELHGLKTDPDGKKDPEKIVGLPITLHRSPWHDGDYLMSVSKVYSSVMLDLIRHPKTIKRLDSGFRWNDDSH